MADSSSPENREIATTAADAPSNGVLLGLVALGVAQLAWAAFQWNELIAHRSGEEAFCGIAALGDCTVLWDSSFATLVRDWTQLPVAAWGVVWGIAAAGLPLIAWLRRSAHPSLEPFWSGVVLTALAGASGVVVLLAASTKAGTLCANCVGTYLLVVAYAGLALWAAFRRGPVALGPGLLAALAPVAAGYLVLLYPALQTPPAVAQITALVESGPAAPSESSAPVPPPSADEMDSGLRDLLTRLEPEAQQLLSNYLERYRSAPPVELRPVRGLIGSPAAKVRLTEFADLLCSHCANLHMQLDALRKAVPQTVLSIEPRYFPLDSRCNPEIGEPQPPYTTPDTRCVAAKAMICASGRPDAFELAGELFRNQASLTPESVVTTASQFIPEAELQQCLAAPQTDAALAEDIAWATEHDIRGTPLILLNGRRIPTNGALIYALLLAGGDPNHPAFAALPPPAEPEAESAS